VCRVAALVCLWAHACLSACCIDVWVHLPIPPPSAVLQVMFSKSTIFKGKIISSSHDGAQSCYTLWYDLVCAHLATMSAATNGEPPYVPAACLSFC
jgi:hypothetical protein